MKKNTTFEQAITRLDEIVAALDGGETTLDQSLKLFSEGADLITFCNTRLKEAELTIEKLFPEDKQDD